MIASIICRQYGWTWEDYQNQPVEFLETILLMLEAENKNSK